MVFGVVILEGGLDLETNDNIHYPAIFKVNESSLHCL